MADREKLILDTSFGAPANALKKKERAGLPWCFASSFLFFWVLLFFAVVIPIFYRLPTALTMDDANNNQFIAQRAYKQLYSLSNIGLKMLGSNGNEIEAVQFLMKELNQIKEEALRDYFDMEIDLSQASGTFALKHSLRVYQGVQNIAVKLTPRNSTSESYLLVNSHFDSKPATPSAGDAGFMIVTMLEVLRVIATTKQSIQHPIVFLFNGAEEGALEGSHGFITQHKWASNCKAVVNLDAGGSGGREVLFQSGPNHPWLVDYYKKYIKYPFATTMAEEGFQSGTIPSDTDFRQFNKYGKLPGLDMAQCINGFVYHTKYDVIDIIPLESLQNTGDNILSLVRGLANATELHDTEAHGDGHAVFFDFLGLYFIHYSETTGIFINLAAAASALILVFLSMWRMSAVSHESFSNVAHGFILVLIIQTICCVLGLALPLIVAHVMDNWQQSLTYYSSPLLLIGLYVCPSLIGLSLPLTIYFSFQHNAKISRSYHLQLALHAQAVILAILTIALTAYGLRTAYILVIPLIFYVLALALNLLTTLHDRGLAWTGLLKVSQIVPFLYSSYLFYFFIVVLTPMGGRSFSSSNPDISIALLSAAGTILSFGFLLPLINTFRRPSFVVLTLITITALALYLASSTQIGFPYRAKTNGQRVAYLQVRNIFYEYDGTLSRDESGYLFNFQDRLKEKPLLGTSVNLTGLISLKSKCEQHMMCGMPLYDSTYVLNRHEAKWLPRFEPIEPPARTELSLLSKTIQNTTTVRFEFNLTGPPQMKLFIQPYEDVLLSNWSFLQIYLETPLVPPLPYFISFSYGIDKSPLHFFLEFTKPNGDFDVPLFQLGVSGHYIGHQGDAQSVKFASSFPPYAILEQWPALYQRFIF
ncbi:endoplasmic reticulum metallopeptidase 1 [Drosophila mojavensis]|uniref:FXNA-like protease n=1 Tax=Drosophila mojavensis TaxID=7230 RepID=A0A0Q9XL30_DROMO|nr:endoplasmic reticulum metallopeptidase 1 [Drosophila mojavensis]KRG04648.1 uncharacterized protein Dmoj_GI26884 [Drosophila mojavensis]